MENALSLEDTERLLDSIRIPSAPAILLELQEALQQEEPDMGAVSDAIERDVGMSSLVLKTVNSAFFGLRHKARSIRQATALLGLINIGNIVTGLALKRALQDRADVTPPEFWDSPVNVAMVAAMLAQRYGSIPPDEAYMLGLFQNAGEVLMAQRFPDYLSCLNASREECCDLAYKEDDRYGTNHAVIGYFISASWGLPKHIQQIILRHHDAGAFLAEDDGVASVPRTLMAVLKMAEHIDACFWGRRDNPEWRLQGEYVLQYLGVSSIEFLDVTDDMVELLLIGQS